VARDDVHHAITTAPPHRGRCAPWNGWIALGVALLAVAVASPALVGGFVLDDSAAVTGSPCVTGSFDLGRIFGRTFWCEDPGGSVQTASWRPWTVLAWWPLWRLGSGAPWPFHALSVGLHAAAAAMVMAVARAAGAKLAGATAAGLAFALLPIHADVAASVVGAAAGWSALFTLGALWLVVSDDRPLAARAAGALVLGGLAVLAREDGALALPVAWLAVVFHGPSQAHEGRRERAVVATGVTLGVVAVLLVRAWVLGAWTAAAVPTEVNAVVELDPVARLKTGFGLAARYHALVAWGGPLAADYAYDAIPVGAAMPWLEAAVGALLIGTAMAGVWFGRRHAGLVVGLGWWICGVGLASNFIVVTPATFAERMVFGASAGLCLALSVGVDAVCSAAQPRPRTKRLAAVLASIWCATMALRFGVHAWRWQDERRLVEHTAAIVPRNARARAWAAELALRAADPTAALEHALAAQRVRPRWGRAVAFEAVALDALDQPERALERLRVALELDAADPQVADLFVQFLLRYGHVPQAQLVYARHAAARGGVPDPSVTRPPPAP